MSVSQNTEVLETKENRSPEKRRAVFFSDKLIGVDARPAKSEHPVREINVFPEHQSLRKQP